MLDSNGDESMVIVVVMMVQNCSHFSGGSCRLMKEKGHSTLNVPTHKTSLEIISEVLEWRDVQNVRVTESA